MKYLKLFLIIVLNIISFPGFAQSENSPGIKSYKQAIGGRLGFVVDWQTYSNIDFLAVSYKRFLSRKSAIEMNLGWGSDAGNYNRHHRFSLAPSYQFHFPIGQTGIAPYIGAGGVLVVRNFSRTFSDNLKEVNEGKFGTGVAGILGIDYKSRRNFNIAIDLQPTWIYYGTNYLHNPIYAGVSLRRTF